MTALPDYTQGDLLALEGMDSAVNAADPAWISAAQQIITDLIREGGEWTTDIIHFRLEALGLSTTEPRALGGVIRAALRSGELRQTGRWVKSQRPACHSRPLPVYGPRRAA